jgi:hypothetical protein
MSVTLNCRPIALVIEINPLLKLGVGGLLITNFNKNCTSRGLLDRDAV